MSRAIAELNIVHPYSPTGYLTISLGIAYWYPTNQDSPKILIAAADEALYRAKNAGRNQYVWLDK